MRICLVGGIYDCDANYRAHHQLTPETILASGLRAAGVDVVELGHRAFVSARGFDLVHVHHLGRAAILAATDAQVPLVFTGHDGPLMAGQASWRRRQAFGFVAQRAQRVIALSEQERRFLRTLTTPTAVVTIANGIPIERFPLGAGSAPGASTLVYVGQLSHAKGVGTLFEALARLRAHGITPTLQLAYQIAPDEQPLRAQVQALGLADQVQFLGACTPDHLAVLYGHATCVVLPSFAESLPSVLIEALYCGAPLVSTTVGGIPELVGEHGLLVPPGDAARLAEVLRLALSEGPGTLAMRAQRRAYALDAFGVPRMIERHLACYTDVLQHPRRIRGARTARVVSAVARRYWSVPVPPMAMPQQ